MKSDEIEAIKAKRYEPLLIQDVVKITCAIKAYEPLQKEHGIFLGEFALRVSLHLQAYPRLKEIEKRDIEHRNKTDADILREIADGLDNADY